MPKYTKTSSPWASSYVLSIWLFTASGSPCEVLYLRRHILFILAGILAISITLAPVSSANRSRADIHFTNGLIYFALGFQDLAITELQKAASLEPGNSEVRVALGMAYHAKGDWQAALAAYGEALRVDDSLLHVHGLMGDIYRVRGDKEKARAHYLRAMEDSELVAVPAYGLGVLAEEAGDRKTAVERYRQVLEAAPDHAESAARLAALLHQDGAVEEALEVVENAQRYNPRVAELHYLGGLFYLELEKYEEAEHALDRTLQLDENHDGARRALRQLESLRQQ